MLLNKTPFTTKTELFLMRVLVGLSAAFLLLGVGLIVAIIIDFLPISLFVILGFGFPVYILGFVLLPWVERKFLND